MDAELPAHYFETTRIEGEPANATSPVLFVVRRVRRGASPLSPSPTCSDPDKLISSPPAAISAVGRVPPPSPFECSGRNTAYPALKFGKSDDAGKNWCTCPPITTTVLCEIRSRSHACAEARRSRAADFTSLKKRHKKGSGTWCQICLFEEYQQRSPRSCYGTWPVPRQSADQRAAGQWVCANKFHRHVSG